MDIEGEDGSKTGLKSGCYAVLGRGAGFNTKDRSISRYHILFHLEEKTENETRPRVSFQVIGRNPIWVRTSTSNESGEIKVFRKIQKGELAVGDWFCFPSETHNPVWFTLKERNGVGEESFQLFQIDPVKEFGFLVIGHEFDCYPKGRICDVRNWNWFLEEEGGQDSEDDEGLGRKGKQGGRRKRRKGGGGDKEEEDDDDWRVESEVDKEVVGKKRKVESVKKYSTRSKEGKKKTNGETKRKENYARRKRICSNKDGGEDDNDDDTLGGFIVNDEEEEQEEESDEEEEFTDDDEEEDEELDD